MDIKSQIIDKIKRNKISTTEVADCLGKTGVIPNANAVNRGHFAVGSVKWIYAYEESNWPIHEQARDINEGDVVFIEAFDCGDRALQGELVTKFMVLYRQAVAVVTNGLMRDANDLIKENYPVWCKGFTPVGCFNRKPSKEFDPEIIKTHKEMYDGAVAVCDDTGVVVIPKDKFTEDFLGKLDFIEQQEDIWFDCLDRMKWDTFDIVCLKKYLEDRK
ncbi:MAG: RraA family protein [Clostridiales bacterium]|nr:RraA family protein [Clostridiales bacterium]